MRTTIGSRRTVNTERAPESKRRACCLAFHRDLDDQLRPLRSTAAHVAAIGLATGADPVEFAPFDRIRHI
jgi:hypothetical protein